MIARARLRRVWTSYRGLPAGVQMWMPLLFGVNMAGFAFLGTEIGFWTAVAIAFVASINLTTMLIQGGLSRLLAFPHFLWAPLIIYIAMRLFGYTAGTVENPEFSFGLMVMVVNGISLMFDVVDASRWLGGDRKILGMEGVIHA